MQLNFVKACKHIQNMSLKDAGQSNIDCEACTENRANLTIPHVIKINSPNAIIYNIESQRKILISSNWAKI